MDQLRIEYSSESDEEGWMVGQQLPENEEKAELELKGCLEGSKPYRVRNPVVMVTEQERGERR